MEKFDSIYKAVRYIKSELPNVGEYDQLYLMMNTYSDEVYVTEDKDVLEKIIEQDWCDCGCDTEPDSHVEDYKIWAYETSENAERWEELYRNYKPTLLSKSHIRGQKNPVGEVIASFTVSRW
ncbi:hypothetical protein [Paenibacillus larvae]|uniref:hypothetical protein n=1 Tax=Paenibacillus larvae TaxID=1464 RepID=UPI000CF4D7FD|nr:hypothetical protein [Paenibacillus larvae]MCY9500314.1 hypothetical protein [Paenibacillus larvae]MDR5608751.1 hypothetical protein [Paenibacillus larvae]